ncbi:helix-turn-helix transcriptional regulator [Actinocatenispora rupis]|uniref:AraC family transcriptional regulator n=1 Tax=Actinocatenispora rupis TaxID=519421 RepID=A0A8J3IVK0_9ACTN|nr:AraC family transcriptional regulator [Actinocatenispora rupis]GID10751.1 AraC family transcriptional regulator [Actinocatenispora rupis]
MEGWARYLTPGPAHRRLGLVCLGAGAQRGTGPPCRDRVLSCHAAVLLAAGRGELVQDARHALVAPVVFWLRPGVRHSYRPDAGGWSEYWLLFEGPAAGAYEELGWLPAEPVTPLPDPAPVRRAFGRLAEAVRADEPDVPAAAAVHDLLVTVRRSTGATRSPVLAALRRDATRRWPVAEHARRLGLSETALRRAVRAAAGTGPGEYLLGVRLTLAKELLAGTDRTVAAVARHVGYDDPGYFTRLFTRRVGVAPSAFREQQQR